MAVAAAAAAAAETAASIVGGVPLSDADSRVKRCLRARTHTHAEREQEQESKIELPEANRWMLGAG